MLFVSSRSVSNLPSIEQAKNVGLDSGSLGEVKKRKANGEGTKVRYGERVTITTGRDDRKASGPDVALGFGNMGSFSAGDVRLPLRCLFDFRYSEQ